MINDNHNSACGFAEDLVSYLYGEIGAAEQQKFEAHLLKCKACADELSVFGAVRSSVADWRERDFAPLQTPAFELPLAKIPATVETVSDSDSRSWLSSLRQMFSLSPALAGTAAACAALVICAGLFYIAVSSLQPGGGSEISGVEKEQKPPVVKTAAASPTVEAAATPPDAAEPEIEQTGNSPKPKTTDNKKPLNPSGIDKRNVAAIPENNSPPVMKSKTQPKTAAVKDKTTVNTPRKPARANLRLVTDEDEEEDSLRLTDLFDEIGER